jgi:heme exporter protein B
VAAKLWWMISKDLLSEYRSRRTWPAMLLLGIVVALMFTVQMDLPPKQQRRVVGGLLWLAIFFAGTLALDRSFAAEREEGCWEGLLLYPVSSSTVYLAKLAVNVLALAALQCVLIPVFVVLSDVPLLAHPWQMILIALLANLGISAVGTLLSALATGIRHSGYLLPLLVLPTVIPVVLAAAEATRLTIEGQFAAEWWRWVQLLGAFAVLFGSVGMALFTYAIED